MHLPPANDKQGQADEFLVSRRYAWFVFAMTFTLMLFDYIDRQIIVSMFPHLKAEWDLSDKQLGALVSVVSLSVALGTIPISLVADRFGRVKSIFVMATVWSLATISCAFTRNYSQLFAARAMIGLGEAGYGSSGAALLASIFPRRLRSTVLGGFLAAASLGSVLGVLLGGFIAQRWGWKAAFGAVGFPGLVVALLFLFVRDYKTVPLAKPATGDAGRARVIVSTLLKPRTAIYACLGSSMQLFVVGALYTWLPSFLNRYYGLPTGEAGLKAAIVILLGAAGAVVWGAVVDRAGRKQPRRKLHVLAGLCLLTLALLATAFGALPPGGLQFALICVSGFVMTCTIGAVAAVVIDVIHTSLRATGASMVALIQNLLGLAAGAFVTGALSDALGLQQALAIIPFICLVAAGFFIVAARSYEADLASVKGVPLSIDDAAAAPAIA